MFRLRGSIWTSWMLSAIGVSQVLVTLFSVRAGRMHPPSCGCATSMCELPCRSAGASPYTVSTSDMFQVLTAGESNLAEARAATRVAIFGPTGLR